MQDGRGNVRAQLSRRHILTNRVKSDLERIKPRAVLRIARDERLGQLAVVTREQEVLSGLGRSLRPEDNITLWLRVHAHVGEQVAHEMHDEHVRAVVRTVSHIQRGHGAHAAVAVWHLRLSQRPLHRARHARFLLVKVKAGR